MEKSLLNLIKNQSMLIIGNPNLIVKNLAFNVADVQNDTLFFSLKNDLSTINSAIKMGAVAIVSEEKYDINIPQIIVPNIRKALSILSANFYDNPSKNMKLIGITGTNGKTTSTYILKSILNANNKKVGVIGTNGYVIGANQYSLNLTTPDPIQLQEILYKMARANCDYVVMEVSAHAIYFDKIEGLEFEAGILTNLTEDHLDFFSTMDNYAKTKQKFFSHNYLKRGIINIDDDLGKEIYLNASLPIITYGLNSKAQVCAYDIKPTLDGTFFTLSLLDSVCQTHFAIPGKHNIYNVLASATCAYSLGVAPQVIKKGIENLESVKGRFEIYSLHNGAYAIVDYAHTPDGLLNILKAVSSLCCGRIITVFGCGGNREKEKRSIMGRIAGDNSDFCFITSDNPRFENPMEIIGEIEKGIKDCQVGYECIENRKIAVLKALKMSKNGDCVVICGKGAESYQEINGVKYHFCDSAIIESWDKKQKKQDYENFEK